MNSTNAKKLSKLGEMWVKSAVRDMKKREKLEKKKPQKKRTQKKRTQKKRKQKKKPQKKRTQKKKKKRKFIQNISEKKYKSLIVKTFNKKRLTKKDRKLLDDTLFYKYCKCNLNFEKKKQKGYGICMNSIYKNRGFKTPNIRKGNRCKDIFKNNLIL